MDVSWLDYTVPSFSSQFNLDSICALWPKVFPERDLQQYNSYFIEYFQSTKMCKSLKIGSSVKIQVVRSDMLNFPSQIDAL